MLRKTIIITGASSGIGAALTKELAEESHTLFICARRKPELERVAVGFENVTPFCCDVADVKQLRAFASFVKNQVGTVDVLINCAGTYGAIGSVLDVKSEDWFSTLETNILGTFGSIQSFISLMENAESPRIINFAGGGAFDPLPNYSAYAVSKAGIVRLTETVARELAPLKISVNAVAPGFVATEIHKSTIEAGRERVGSALYDMTMEKLRDGAIPIDVPIACVRYLISPKSDGLTGKTLSASFDPWASDAFAEHIIEINKSPLYTMQRINLVHLECDKLKNALTPLQEKKNG